MDKFLKASIFIMIFSLLMQLFPAITFAQNFEAESVTEVLLFAAEKDGHIELFEDESAEKVISIIPDSTTVELLDLKEEYSKVLLIPVISDDESNSSQAALTGFVQTIHVVNLLDKDDFLEQRKDENFILEGYRKDNFEENMLSEEVNNSSELINELELENQNKEITIKKEPSLQAKTEELIETKQEFSEKVNKDIDLDRPEVLKKKTEDQLEVIQSEKNEINTNKNFMVSTFSSTFVAAVPAVSKITLKGVALNTSTKIYSQTSTASSVLKSYKQGHILLFQSHNSNWYIATVYIGGKPQTGYINVNDVDVLVEQQRLVGYGLVQPVHVYQSPTRNNGVLKSYKRGARLIYRTFSSQWHEATVIINGKARTGYIHVNDVGPALPLLNVTQLPVPTVTQAPIKGVAVSKLVSVYSTTSTNSAKLKSYSQGRVLLYRPFNSAWYEATVYVNGKARTGYINRNDVENVVTNSKSVRGIAVNSPTRVYSKASTLSKSLKSYSFGKGLIYRTFTDSWYEATVYVNGKPTTGYIHKSHVVNVTGKKIVLDPGHGGSDSGAKALGIIEKELNLDIALRTKKLLENAGFSVFMTRTTDTYVSLAGRAAIANNLKADIFVSIHGNAFNSSARGVETFWYGKFEKANSNRLANLLQYNVVSKTNISHRRVAEGNFHVIRETAIPSALLEVGFIDNPSDAAKLKQSKYRQLAAEGIMLGVLDYFK
ncbi:N-acetylmuramoyl-L-alanine amidase family protein [Sporosarcina jiandibaonis]|uniref:N-acetylmuramoyl-L-alanine amidase family protein n=1 Tax=Sporosarcina jiandibaonis TaxID=2715535 RepID=UPI001557CE4D|nr:N-acetylmuramoyl-L-alanine amidase [Sporosarcina jiandibaonis]